MSGGRKGFRSHPLGLRGSRKLSISQDFAAGQPPLSKSLCISALLFSRRTGDLVRHDLGLARAAPANPHDGVDPSKGPLDRSEPLRATPFTPAAALLGVERAATLRTTASPLDDPALVVRAAHRCESVPRAVHAGRPDPLAELLEVFRCHRRVTIHHGYRVRNLLVANLRFFPFLSDFSPPFVRGSLGSLAGGPSQRFHTFAISAPTIWYVSQSNASFRAPS